MASAYPYEGAGRLEDIAENRQACVGEPTKRCDSRQDLLISIIRSFRGLAASVKEALTMRTRRISPDEKSFELELLDTRIGDDKGQVGDGDEERGTIRRIEQWFHGVCQLNKSSC